MAWILSDIHTAPGAMGRAAGLDRALRRTDERTGLMI